MYKHRQYVAYVSYKQCLLIHTGLMYKHRQYVAYVSYKQCLLIFCLDIDEMIFMFENR